jgi:hypothetical protein
MDRDAVRALVFAFAAHLHHDRQQRFGRLQVRDAERDRPKAADLIFGRNRALVPGVRLPGAAIVEQAEALALRILEVEGESAAALAHSAVGNLGLVEPAAPPLQGRLTGHSQCRAHDRMAAAALAADRPVEESEARAGGGEPIGIEEVIGGDVVLVDRLLDQAHPEHISVEGEVARRVGRDRGEVVDAGELHGSCSPRR